MKRIVFYILFFKFSILACLSQVIEDTSLARHVLSKKSDLAIFPAHSKELFPGTERFTPDHKDVEKAEQALTTQLTALNVDKMNQFETPVIDKNLPKYRRQYFGYIDKKGNRILFINCLWKNKKEWDILWLKERIRVLEGGSFYWNVKYNLNTNELFDLDVNGQI